MAHGVADTWYSWEGEMSPEMIINLRILWTGRYCRVEENQPHHPEKKLTALCCTVQG